MDAVSEPGTKRPSPCPENAKDVEGIETVDDAKRQRTGPNADRAWFLSIEDDACAISIPRKLLEGSALLAMINQDKPAFFRTETKEPIWRVELSSPVLRAVAQSLSVGYIVVGHGASLDSMKAAFEYLCLRFQKQNVEVWDDTNPGKRRDPDSRHEVQTDLMRRLAARISDTDIFTCMTSSNIVSGERVFSAYAGLRASSFAAGFEHEIAAGDATAIQNATGVEADTVSCIGVKLFGALCRSQNELALRQSQDCSRMLVEFLPNTSDILKRLTGNALTTKKTINWIDHWYSGVVSSLALEPPHNNNLDRHLPFPVFMAVHSFLRLAEKYTGNSTCDVHLSWKQILSKKVVQPRAAGKEQWSAMKSGDFERVKDVVLAKCFCEAGDRAKWLYKGTFTGSFAKASSRMLWFATRISKPRSEVSLAIASAGAQSQAKLEFDNAVAEHEFCVAMLRFVCSALGKEPDWHQLLSNQFADEDGGEATPARTKVAAELKARGIRVVRWKTVYARNDVPLHEPGPFYFPPFLNFEGHRQMFPGPRTQALLEWIPSAEMNTDA